MIKKFHNENYISNKKFIDLDEFHVNSKTPSEEIFIVYDEKLYMETSENFSLKEEVFSYVKNNITEENKNSYFTQNNIKKCLDIYVEYENLQEKYCFEEKSLKEDFYDLSSEDLLLSSFKNHWLKMVSDIDKKPSIKDACNVSLYIMMHFYRKNFLALENSINIIDIRKIPRSSMVIILRYTRISRKKINNWIEFRNKCAEELLRRGEDPKKILRDMLNEK